MFGEITQYDDFDINKAFSILSSLEDMSQLPLAFTTEDPYVHQTFMMDPFAASCPAGSLEASHLPAALPPHNPQTADAAPAAPAPARPRLLKASASAKLHSSPPIPIPRASKSTVTSRCGSPEPGPAHTVAGGLSAATDIGGRGPAAAPPPPCRVTFRCSITRLSAASSAPNQETDSRDKAKANQAAAKPEREPAQAAKPHAAPGFPPPAAAGAAAAASPNSASPIDSPPVKPADRSSSSASQASQSPCTAAATNASTGTAANATGTAPPARPNLRLTRLHSRVAWTPALHGAFIASIRCLGGADRATPKGILMKMRVKGLKLQHIKSHLQKYRKGHFRNYVVELPDMETFCCDDADADGHVAPPEEDEGAMGDDDVTGTDGGGSGGGADVAADGDAGVADPTCSEGEMGTD